MVDYNFNDFTVRLDDAGCNSKILILLITDCFDFGKRSSCCDLEFGGSYWND